MNRESNTLEAVEKRIAENNAEGFKRAFSELTAVDKDALLSRGVLQTEKHGRGRALEEVRPLLFEAIISESFACVPVLLSNGFPLTTRDNNGWNFIHYLTAISHYDHSFEKTAVELCGQTLLLATESQAKDLLQQEDLDGLRPVELALHLSCILLFDYIVNVPGVYLSACHRIGCWERVSFDITEYEKLGCGQTRRGSLLTLACNVDKDILSDEDSVRILKDGMLSQWIAAKLKINLIFLLVWCFWRVTSFLAFYVVISEDLSPYFTAQQNFEELMTYLRSLNFTVNFEDTESWSSASSTVLLDNITYSDTARQTVTNMLAIINRSCFPANWYGLVNLVIFYDMCVLFAMFCSVVSLVFDVIESLVWLCRRSYRWGTVFGKKKSLVTSTLYYRLCQFFFSILVTFWIACYRFAPNHLFQDYGILPTCYLSVWTVLFFLQILPSVGKFVNSIQRMLIVMFQFLIVYVILLIPYPHAFYFLLRETDQCQVAGFSSLMDATYTVFKMMLNMVDFGDYTDIPSGIHAVHILHIIYVFTVAILLVNFLIALLSSSVGETAEASDLTILLQRLSVLQTVESRMTKIFPCFYQLVNRHVYRCENGKMYLQYKKFAGPKQKLRFEKPEEPQIRV